MKKIFLYLIVIVSASVALSGCLPEKDETRLAYKGPTEVEFKNPTLGVNTTLLGKIGISTAAADAQNDSTHTVLINARPIDSILVQLVGPQRSTPTVVSFNIRNTSTAVEGTHYNFAPVGSHSVTIPANASFAYLIINPIANSIPVVGNSVTLNIELIGTGDTPVSFNYKAFFEKLKR